MQMESNHPRPQVQNEISILIAAVLMLTLAGSEIVFFCISRRSMLLAFCAPGILRYPRALLLTLLVFAVTASFWLGRAPTLRALVSVIDISRNPLRRSLAGRALAAATLFGAASVWAMHLVQRLGPSEDAASVAILVALILAGLAVLVALRSISVTEEAKPEVLLDVQRRYEFATVRGRVNMLSSNDPEVRRAIQVCRFNLQSDPCIFGPDVELIDHQLAHFARLLARPEAAYDPAAIPRMAADLARLKAGFSARHDSTYSKISAALSDKARSAITEEMNQPISRGLRLLFGSMPVLPLAEPELSIVPSEELTKRMLQAEATIVKAVNATPRIVQAVLEKLTAAIVNGADPEDALAYAEMLLRGGSGKNSPSGWTDQRTPDARRQNIA